MVKMEAVYQGDLHCQITHGPSGEIIFTDAPVDNQGKGESFSPTDLLGASLASCIATTIAIYANRKGWDMKGMRVEVEKEMQSVPERKIRRLVVKVWIPLDLSEEDRVKVERVAHTCPVHKSIDPSVDMPITFEYA